MSTRSVESGGVEETIGLGRRLGEALQPGDVVALTGPLGAGKTHFTKGIARGLGIADVSGVISPSFVLVREYLGRCALRHVDAYRLHDASELVEIGAEELFDELGVTVVEWADRFPADEVPATLTVQFQHEGPSTRTLTFVPRNRRGEELIREAFDDPARDGDVDAASGQVL
jgi:tRNA threonylcarbamoyladenosine biosynthesis protein TsaE